MIKMYENFDKIMELSNRMNKLEMVLLLKCEICGPKLRGAKGDYPAKCPRHDK
jgi:predicted Zn-ribbon and HTH transcriptional regulator